MNKILNALAETRVFLALWLSQSFSGLGSSMTAYALVIWSYEQKDSALATAILMVCLYAPYVVFGIFAGALSDKWDKKKTMLVCDSAAALTTAAVLVLLESGSLELWHIYVINIIGGFMNTLQDPASTVATTLLLPKKYYQKLGGLRFFASSLNSIFTPVIATAFMGLFGIRAVLLFDLFTFGTAFVTLLVFIKIPKISSGEKSEEKFLASVKSGIIWLKNQKGIFTLILFLAVLNFVDSMYNAAFPAMMLSRNNGSETVMGVVNTVIGASSLIGSVITFFMKPPKSRVRAIWFCLLFSVVTEYSLLAFGSNVWVWSLAGFLGWIVIPPMNANMDVVLRTNIPVEMQGRIYSVRDSLQFCMIPAGYFFGGFAVDCIFEPLMAAQSDNILTALFGTGKGSGAALFFFILAIAGTAVCLLFRKSQHLWEIEKDNS